MHSYCLRYGFAKAWLCWRREELHQHVDSDSHVVTCTKQLSLLRSALAVGYHGTLRQGCRFPITFVSYPVLNGAFAKWSNADSKGNLELSSIVKNTFLPYPINHQKQQHYKDVVKIHQQFINAFLVCQQLCRYALSPVT